MAEHTCVLLLLGLSLVLMLVPSLLALQEAREHLSFVNYTDPIMPDGEVYLTQYWPRAGGQLGQNIFSGWPQYFKAY